MYIFTCMYMLLHLLWTYSSTNTSQSHQACCEWEQLWVFLLTSFHQWRPLAWQCFWRQGEVEKASFIHVLDIHKIISFYEFWTLCFLLWDTLNINNIIQYWLDANYCNQTKGQVKCSILSCLFVALFFLPKIYIYAHTFHVLGSNSKIMHG